MYKGGFAAKPEQSVAYENLTLSSPRDPSAPAQPLRLPLTLADWVGACVVTLNLVFV